MSSLSHPASCSASARIGIAPNSRLVHCAREGNRGVGAPLRGERSRMERVAKEIAEKSQLIVKFGSNRLRDWVRPSERAQKDAPIRIVTSMERVLCLSTIFAI